MSPINISSLLKSKITPINRFHISLQDQLIHNKLEYYDYSLLFHPKDQQPKKYLQDLLMFFQFLQQELDNLDSEFNISNISFSDFISAFNLVSLGLLLIFKFKLFLSSLRSLPARFCSFNCDFFFFIKIYYIHLTFLDLISYSINYIIFIIRN